MALPLLQSGIKGELEKVLKIHPRPLPDNVVPLPPRSLNTEQVRSLLAVLDPDLAYDDWRNVVWSVKSTGLPEGKNLACEWSAGARKWDPGAFQTVWNSFDPSRADGISFRTLLFMAREAGWCGDLKVSSTTKYRLLSSTDIRAMPPMSWRVKGVLPETGVAAIYGPSGSGKSFLAFDLACAVAAGDPWYGNRTIPAPVSIVWLEGEAGISKRWQAQEKHHSREIPDTVGVVAQPFDIASGDVEALAEVLPRDGVVLIDTLNRAAPGKDENNSLDMGEIIGGAKRLQALVGGLVVFIHHTGKDAAKGLRGHSSLYAALDAAIEVRRDKNGRSWSIAKSKDGEDGGARNFKLEVIFLGLDADGEAISSCVAVPDVDRLLVPDEPTGANQKVALRAIRERWRTLYGPWLGENQSPRLSWGALVELVAPQLPAEMKRAKTRAKEAIDGLVMMGHLCPLGGEGQYTLKS